MEQLKNINGYALMIFSLVYEHKSFSIVARLQHVAPSTISRVISQLEQSLNCQLFHRNTRAVIATEHAEMLIDYARNISQNLTDIFDQIGEQRREIQGRVRLNAPVLFGQLHIAPWLAELNARFPKLVFELILTDEFIDPFKSSTDIIFRMNHLPDSNFHARVFHQVQYYLLASPQYLKQHATINSPVDLIDHQCLVYQGVYGPNKWYFKTNEQLTATAISATLTSNNAAALTTAAKQGMGLVLFPDWLVYEEIQTGTLIPLLSEYQGTIYTEPQFISVIYPHTKKMPTKVRTVIDFFIEKFGCPAYWQCD